MASSGPVPGRGKHRTLDLAILISLAITAALFWKLRIIDPAEPGELSATLANMDFFTYTLPVAVGAARSIRNGELPLWNPYQSSGHPALAAVPAGLLYPLNFPFLLLPPHWAIEMTVVLHLFLAGALMYGYGRTISLRPVAAAGAALTFMLSGFVVSRAVWFTPALAGCVWLPAGFIAIEKIFARGGMAWMILLGVAVAMPVLAGWLQVWTYSMGAIGLYAGVRLAVRVLRTRRRAEVAGIVLLLAGGLVLGLSLAAVQLLPSIELQNLGPRAGTLSGHQSLMFPRHPPSQVVLNAADPTPGPPRWNYLGMAALLLIPLSLLSRSGRLRVACLWCLAILGFSVLLGNQTPILALLLKLPTGSWFRIPQRAVFLYAFAGSILSGIAIHGLAADRLGMSGRRAWVGVGGVALVAAALSASMALPASGLAYLWATAVAIACAIRFPSPGIRSAVLGALVVLLGWDLFHATRNPHQHPIHRPELASRERQAFDYVIARQGLYRTYIGITSPLDFAVIAKHGTLERIYAVADYEPLSLARDAQLFRLFDRRDQATLDLRPFNGRLDADPWSPRFDLIDLMSVRFALVHSASHRFRRGMARRRDQWREVFRPARGKFIVYENRAPLPRAYLASAWIAVAGPEEALAVVAGPSFDPRRSVVLEGIDPALDRPEPRAERRFPAARIVRYRPSEVVVEAEASEAGYLVLTDSFYPGWTATVDGSSRQIYRANYLFRAVLLEPGRHRVIFRYQPLSFRVGAALTLTALLGIVATGALRFGKARNRRGGRAWSALLLVGVLGLDSGCASGDGDLPNVVVIVVDTLRRDHLGSYGYARDVSPVSDALAMEGVVFEQAITVAPRTWQSFTSILTGLYPPRHGVRHIFDRPLGPRVPTMASVLGSAGYRTAAFDGMNFLREMTRGRAFREYVDPAFLASSNPMLGDHKVIDAFVDWLGRTRSPFFAFLRLSAPHWSYVCPDRFHGEVSAHGGISHAFNAGSHGLGLVAGGIGITDEAAYRARFYGYDPSPRERDHMILHYDECVRDSDAAIGRALARLRELRFFDSTLVVLTSDHGESFGEHGYLQHGPRVDGPVMRVPLIFRFPASMARGRRGVRVRQLVRTVDVFPTVVDALGLAVPPGLDGETLLSVVDSGAELNLTAYGESGRAFVGVDPGIHIPGVAGKRRMLRTLDWKLVYIPDPHGGSQRLYDLVADPGETRDVSAQHPLIAARLRARLDQIMGAEAGAIDDAPALTEEEESRLRALGYL